MMLNKACSILLLYFANFYFPNRTRWGNFMRQFLAAAGIPLALASSWIVDPDSRLVAATLRSFGLYHALKTIDLHFARGSQFVPRYGDGRLPDPSNITDRIVYARKLTYQMRYEDFNISVVKTGRRQSHPFQEGAFSLILVALISASVGVPPHISSSIVSAFFFFLCLHACFCAMYILPGFNEIPLFEEHFLLTRSLTEFWSVTWHGLFTSPIKTLAFLPVRRVAGKSGGVMAAMAFSGAMHWFMVLPLGREQGAFRVFVFFLVQGPGCILDAILFGKSQNLWRRAFAWYDHFNLLVELLD